MNEKGMIMIEALGGVRPYFAAESIPGGVHMKERVRGRLLMIAASAALFAVIGILAFTVPNPWVGELNPGDEPDIGEMILSAKPLSEQTSESELIEQIDTVTGAQQNDGANGLFDATFERFWGDRHAYSDAKALFAKAIREVAAAVETAEDDGFLYDGKGAFYFEAAYENSGETVTSERAEELSIVLDAAVMKYYIVNYGSYIGGVMTQKRAELIYKIYKEAEPRISEICEMWLPGLYEPEAVSPHFTLNGKPLLSSLNESELEAEMNEFDGEMSDYVLGLMPSGAISLSDEELYLFILRESYYLESAFTEKGADAVSLEADDGQRGVLYRVVRLFVKYYYLEHYKEYFPDGEADANTVEAMKENVISEYEAIKGK